MYAVTTFVPPNKQHANSNEAQDLGDNVQRKRQRRVGKGENDQCPDGEDREHAGYGVEDAAAVTRIDGSSVGRETVENSTRNRGRKNSTR